jgi:pimeloyl-ACP methyl ester carboxylesterase
MQEKLSFMSDGLKLSAVLHVPEGRKPGQRLPAFIVLHGFVGSKDESHAEIQARMLEDFGYAALRFDFRCCGESEGEHGQVRCFDQVADAKNALTFLAQREEIDPQRIGVIGHSFGAAVAVYAAGVDGRFACVISSCGWGHGERKFRGQHPTPEAWAKFANMLEEGKRHRERTGKSLMVPRYDIVPIPQHVGDNLAAQNVRMFPPGSINEFPAETAQSMFDFRADDVVGKIAPRPLLLLHSANDSVTPTEQSVEMFKRAGQPTELHLLSGVDHFMFHEDSKRVWALLQGWLDTYFPVRAH